MHSFFFSLSQFSATVNVLTDPLSHINAMLCEAWENDFLSKLARGPIGDNIVCFFMKNSGLGRLSTKGFIYLIVKEMFCFPVFPMLMLRAICWQQISGKREKNFYLWSFFKVHNKVTDDRINLLYVTDRHFFLFFHSWSFSLQSLCWGTLMQGPVLMTSQKVEFYFISVKCDIRRNVDGQ